jgi:hypothetical protein
MGFSSAIIFDGTAVPDDETSGSVPVFVVGIEQLSISSLSSE